MCFEYLEEQELELLLDEQLFSDVSLEVELDLRRLEDFFLGFFL